MAILNINGMFKNKIRSIKVGRNLLEGKLFYFFNLWYLSVLFRQIFLNKVKDFKKDEAETIQESYIIAEHYGIKTVGIFL